MISEICDAPSIFVYLKLRYVSFMRLPMSGGMVPGCNEKGQEAIGGHQRRKNKQAKRTDFADHRPGHVIAEPFALTREFSCFVHIELRQIHELPNVRRNCSWIAAGRQDAVGGRQRQKNKFGKKATEFRRSPAWTCDDQHPSSKF